MFEPDSRRSSPVYYVTKSQAGRTKVNGESGGLIYLFDCVHISVVSALFAMNPKSWTETSQGGFSEGLETSK